MWWLLLPLSLFINNFSINLVSQSHTTNNFIYEGLLFISLFQLSKIISQNLESQSFTTENWLCSSYINNLYLYSVWISALFCCAVQLRPLAGNRLRPQTEVVFSASAAAISSYMLTCQCINVSMCTLIRRQYHLTIQVKISCPTDWLVSRNLGSNAAWVLSPPRTVGRDADSVASSHSTPIRVLYCLYSESGLFWAI